jgi:[ribosomal protein S5]-alanine N-acetyltransferase
VVDEMKKRILIDERLLGKRVFLRSRIFDDNAFVFEATRYNGFNDGMPWEKPKTIAEMTDRYHATLEKWINGDAYSYVILEKGNNSRIGMISIRKTEDDDIWDIGYWTHPEKQRMGYMQEAVSLILEFGFKKLEAKSIQAKYAIWSIASEKVLVKNRMKKIEYIEQGFEKNGEWVKENKMEITKEEWLEKRAADR